MRAESSWPVLRSLIRRWTGVCLADRNAPSSLRALSEVAALHGEASMAFLGRATDAGAHTPRQQLIDAVTIGTSWWLRERDSLDRAVEAASRHARQSGVHVVRVWSAGCSTGQEPYSVAMLLLEAGLSPNVTATDVNTQFLRFADRATYSPVQMRGLPAAWRARYFTRHGGGYQVVDAVRGAVSFAQHNLIADPPPPSGRHRFDIVLCRNVLIYFEPEQALAISRSLSRARRPGGSLVLGAVEQPLVDMLDRGDPAPAPRPAHTPPPPRPPAAPAPAPPDGEEALMAAFAALDGDRDDGHFDADEIARQHAMVASAHLLRGLACKRRGDLSAASESFRRASFLDHTSWLAPYQLGLCLEELGKVDDAVWAYRDAMRVLAEGGPSGVPGPMAAEHDAAARTVSDSCWQRIRALSQEVSR